MDMSFDIVIIGTGLIGTSLVVALQAQGWRIAVLETHVPVAAAQMQTESRPLFLAYGSQKILATMGVWQHLAAQAEAIQTVHVSQQHHLGMLRFRASEEHLPALGYVVPFDALQNHMLQQAAQCATVKFIAIQKILRVENQAERVMVTVQTVAGEKTLQTELLVAADGAHSPTRALLNISAIEKFSDEVALTVELELREPHQHTAYQRFTEQGILAILPLQNLQRCRLVWTLSRSLADQVAQWPDAQLADYLSAAVQNRLGQWRVLTRGNVYPLETVLAQQQVRPGVVLLGNAAHTIYPVAAQGFNLGLRDLAVLAEILVEARANRQRLGDERVLTAYVNWRKADQRWITGLTSAVSQLFDCHVPGLAAFRAAGLLITDLILPLKHRLAKRLLGLAGKLPKLARGISL